MSYDLPIGQKFMLKKSGAKLIVVAGTCRGCYFHRIMDCDQGIMDCDQDLQLHCVGLIRKDRTDVRFEKIL